MPGPPARSTNPGLPRAASGPADRRRGPGMIAVVKIRARTERNVMVPSLHIHRGETRMAWQSLHEAIRIVAWWLADLNARTG